jgi:DNA-binding NarL/FixJ family response regulator
MLNAADCDTRCAVRIRVFLIDAEVVVRAGMRLLINSWKNCEVVGEADASSQAISALEAAAPDLIVLSDREFSQNGDSTDSFGGLNKLVEAAGTAPLLLMTNSRNSKSGAHAIKLGAKGIITTWDAPRELHTAIDHIFSGDMWVSKSALRGLVSSRGDERQTESDAECSLTNRGVRSGRFWRRLYRPSSEFPPGHNGTHRTEPLEFDIQQAWNREPI